ncbi:MAG: hypothetical protein NTX03_11280 [Bacteroidetes bacterium]|nr:hypothetical protein [Bacteroidota bacterium]
MNILSHYYLDGIAAKPYYNLGLVFPDLIGGFHRGWRLTSLELSKSSKLLESYNWHQDLHNGCLRHFEVDRRFHNVQSFTDCTRHIRILMDEKDIQQYSIRSFFGAHILYELLLDRLIIKQNIKVADDFYASLEAVNPGKLSIFLKENNTMRHDDFMAFFTKFKESKYIYRYADDEGLFYAFKRIMMRAGLPELPNTATQLFESISFEAENYIASKFISIFEELKQPPANP